MLVVAAGACGRKSGASDHAEDAATSPDIAPEAQPAPARAGAKVRCAEDTSFPGSWALAEASAAAEVELTPGIREMLAVSDSGNNGSAMLWRIPAGPFRSLRLPLDSAASDDLEGLAFREHHLYALTSTGAVRRFSADGRGGVVRDGSAYPIGPPPYACAKLTTLEDCGINYEGLCLRPESAKARCAGYAASKAQGTLYCVVFKGDRLAIDDIKPPLKLALPKNALSDCAFGAAGGPAEDVLLVTTNIFGGSTTYEVRENDGALAALDVTGLPNNEAVAVDRDGALYMMMDGDAPTSPAYRMTCSGWR